MTGRLRYLTICDENRTYNSANKLPKLHSAHTCNGYLSIDLCPKFYLTSSSEIFSTEILGHGKSAIQLGSEFNAEHRYVGT